MAAAKGTTPRIRAALAGGEIAVASLAINLLALAMPLLMLQVYDRIVPNGALNTLTVLAFGVATALLAEALLKLLRASLLSRRAARFEAETSVGAAAHLLNSELAAYEAVPAGRHVERLNAIPQLRDLGSGQIYLTLYDLPFLCAYAALIWMLGGPLALICLIGLVPTVIAAALLGRRMRRALVRVSDASDARYSFLTQALSGLVSVKAMALEAPLQRRYEVMQQDRLSHQEQAQTAGQRLQELSQFLQQATTVGIVGFGSLLVLDGAMSIGALSACTLLAGRFLSLAQNLVLTASRLQSTAVAREQVAELFALPQAPQGRGTLDPRAGKGIVAVDNVTFCYFGDDRRPLLDGVSFTTRPGDIIALVGENGSGKSSLLALLAGLYRPTSGTVAIDGSPLSAFDPQALRETVALVPQRETLFAGTVLDNLTAFDSARIPAALKAAARTGLDKALATMPLGFATPVGDAAAEALPRGLVQRIALTRAIMAQPRLLLLDDATSAIDDRGGTEFAELLQDLRRDSAILLVSHRPSVIRLASRVLRLSGGKIDSLEGVA